MKSVRVMGVFATIVITVFTSSCNNKVVSVPPGYIAKMLTPTGWEDKVYEAGQVDIGTTDSVGRGNQLVLCEATSVTIKEQFAKPSPENGNEDHRIITKDKTPIAVDVYVQVMVPDDKKLRDSIFSQVTPTPEGDQGRVSKITLDQVYTQFAKMSIRGKTRQIFSGYNGYMDVMQHYDEASKRVGGMIAETFEENRVPLKLVGGQLSNVKADETIWTAENRKAAAQAEASAIETVGAAIRANPGYLEKYKWDVVRDLKQNVTLIINDAGRGGGVSYTLPAQK